LLFLLQLRNLLDGPEKLYPEHNYLSGDGLSSVWIGQRNYSPANREWQHHHVKRALPMDHVAGQREFASEDEWRSWQFRRDQHDSKYCGGYGQYKSVFQVLELFVY